MAENFWDMLMGTDEGASTYMAQYGEGPGAQTRHEVGKFINDGESVLDVGSGPSWNYEHFLKFGPKVDYTAMDYSERFVRVVQARQPDIKIMLGDARKLPPVVGAWDVVILQDCLEHTNGFEKPVHEALRVAKKRIIITFWHLDYTDNPHINDDGNDGWGAWYDKGAWEAFLDTLNLHWLHHQFEFPEGRTRDLYVIDKEKPHGA